MRFFYFLTLVISFFFLISSSFKPKPSAKSALKVLNGFCNYVPSGNAVVDGDTVSVQSFYMSSTEITNIQYQEFLNYLRRNEMFEKLEIAQIDSSKWVEKLGFGEPYKQHYHRHPAYHNFPVVNVSRQGAELYCAWLTSIYDSISGGKLKLLFRVPFRSEYLRAARGENHNYVYSWGGPYLRNKQGTSLANYLCFGAENITRNKQTGEYEIVRFPIDLRDNTSDAADVLAPAKSYWPNEFGFYCLNGNVSEMISDSQHAVGGDWKSPGYDIRNESIIEFNEPQPNVGFRVVATYLQPK